MIQLSLFSWEYFPIAGKKNKYSLEKGDLNYVNKNITHKDLYKCYKPNI